MSTRLPLLSTRPLSGIRDRLASGVPLFSSQGRAENFLSIRKLTQGDDAVRTSLSTKEGGAAKPVRLITATGEGGSKSAFGKLLEEVSTLGKRLSSLQATLQNGSAGPNTDAIQEEIDLLQDNLLQLTSEQDKEGNQTIYGQIVQHLSSAAQNPYGGTNRTSNFLLGDDILQFSSAGNQVVLGSLLRDTRELSNAALNEDYSGIGLITKRIYDTLSSAPGAPAQVETIEPTAKPVTFDEPLKVKQFNFAAASEVAIGLRTLSADQMLRAAVTGIDIDAAQSILLTHNVDEEDEKQIGKKEKKEQLLFAVPNEDTAS